jgi:hypothetical protein
MNKRKIGPEFALLVLTFSLAALGWIQLLGEYPKMEYGIISTLVLAFISISFFFSIFKKPFNFNFARFNVLFTWAFVISEILRLSNVVKDTILLISILLVTITVTAAMIMAFIF